MSTSAVNLDRWGFDEGTGTVAKDSTSRAIDGTLKSGATWMPWVSGSAVQLNGTSAYVGMPSRAVIATGGFTVAAGPNRRRRARTRSWPRTAPG